MSGRPLKRNRKKGNVVGDADFVDPCHVLHDSRRERPLDVLHVRDRLHCRKEPAFDRRSDDEADVVLLRSIEDPTHLCGLVDEAPRSGDRCGIELARTEILGGRERAVGGDPDECDLAPSLQLAQGLHDALVSHDEVHVLAHGIVQVYQIEATDSETPLAVCEAAHRSGVGEVVVVARVMVADLRCDDDVVEEFGVIPARRTDDHLAAACAILRRSVDERDAVFNGLLDGCDTERGVHERFRRTQDVLLVCPVWRVESEVAAAETHDRNVHAGAAELFSFHFACPSKSFSESL